MDQQNILAESLIVYICDLYRPIQIILENLFHISCDSPQ